MREQFRSGALLSLSINNIFAPRRLVEHSPVANVFFHFHLSVEILQWLLRIVFVTSLCILFSYGDVKFGKLLA